MRILKAIGTGIVGGLLGLILGFLLLLALEASLYPDFPPFNPYPLMV